MSDNFLEKMKRIFIVFCFCFLSEVEYVRGQNNLYLSLGTRGPSPLDKFSPENLIASGSDALKGVVKQIPSSIPSPETIFSVGKNVLAGYPVAIVFEAINQFCEYFFMEEKF